MKSGYTSFMKIRHYVLDKIAVNPGGTVRFPSTHVLAKELGVSQPTVLRVIKALIDEEVLIPCKGGGTISRPATASMNSNLVIFGLVDCLGKLVFDNPFFELLHHAAASEILRRSSCYMTKTLFLETPSHLERRLRVDNLSGVVLIGAEHSIAEYGRQIREKGTPVASFMFRFEGIPSFYDPIQERFRNTLLGLFKSGRSRILIVCTFNHSDWAAPIALGVEEACTTEGIPRGRVIILNSKEEETLEKVREMMEFGMKFDAVLTLSFRRPCFDLLRKYLNDRETLYFLDFFDIFDDLNFTGYAFQYDFQAGAKMLVDNLFQQLENPDMPPVYEKMPYRLVRYQDGLPQPLENDLEF